MKRTNRRPLVALPLPVGLVLSLLILGQLPAAPSGPDRAPAAVPATIDAFLVCDPAGGTLPFETHLWATVYNLTSCPRAVACRADLLTAGGLYLAGISSGEASLPAGPGQFVHLGWVKPVPFSFFYAGTNEYILRVWDTTAPPFNQPPYPPAGDDASHSCTLQGSMP